MVCIIDYEELMTELETQRQTLSHISVCSMLVKYLSCVRPK